MYGQSSLFPFESQQMLPYCFFTEDTEATFLFSKGLI